MKRLLPLLLLLAGFAQAEEFEARVIAVMDGDTVLVLRNDQKLKVRLLNIDAPELEQPWGRESRDALASRVLKRQVHLSSSAVDAYGRLLADISVDGSSVSEAQVRDGNAWEYSHFHGNQHYVAMEEQARAAHKGLWGQAGMPEAPDLWRKAHPEKYNLINTIGKKAGCGSKHLCSQMKSCDEARLYYAKCGVKTLDGNGDGIPCASLCGAVGGMAGMPKIHLRMP
jgi:micrococcal nuclease